MNGPKKGLYIPALSIRLHPNQLHFFGSGSTISKGGFDYPDPLFRKGGSENLDPDQRQNGMVLICYIWTTHFLVQKIIGSELFVWARQN